MKYINQRNRARNVLALGREGITGEFAAHVKVKHLYTSAANTLVTINGTK